MGTPAQDEKRWPGLRDYWESYGHSVRWEELTGWKERAYDGLYVVLCWDIGDGRVGFADIAGSGTHWEMQNDSEETSTRGWRKLRVKPHVDGFILDEEDE